MRASKGLAEVVSKSNVSILDGLKEVMPQTLDRPPDTGAPKRSKYNRVS